MDWHNCYDDGWKGMIVPEAFAHPAKFAYGLIARIVRHGLDCGYWKPGDVIGDPFGGVALGGILCGYHGLNWVGVELEPRFVELGNRNLAMHGPRWLAMEQTNRVTLLQGDSRRFAELVGSVAGCVTSPPYAATNNQGGDQATHPGMKWKHGERSDRGKVDRSNFNGTDYGTTPGQIGALPSGQLDAVISSPPFAAARAQPISTESGARRTAEIQMGQTPQRKTRQSSTEIHPAKSAPCPPGRWTGRSRVRRGRIKSRATRRAAPSVNLSRLPVGVLRLRNTASRAARSATPRAKPTGRLCTPSTRKCGSP